MLETILNRRSIRRFTERPVDGETVELLLRAAMQAPSAKNEQPWEFVVVRDRSTLHALSQVSPFAKSMDYAPLGIVLLCNRARLSDGNDAFWQQDMSAAAQTILLAAASLDLGTTWLGVAPLEERISAAARILALPEYVVPFAMLPIGYPQQQKTPTARFESERVFSDAYGRT